jgi:DNA-binding transcriptional MerR regulator
MDHENEAAVLRIGELSRRVGVSAHVLRAWESRYGLLKPQRSAGGYRLYSQDDQARVARMQVHLAGGLAAAQAARAVIAEEQPGAGTAEEVDAAPRADLADTADALRRALDDLDEPGAQAVLDRLLTDFTVETVLRDVVMSYLSDLGQRWEQGAVSVAQEHFASNVLRGRLAGLARGWGNGRGPLALLACPPEELHDLGLLVFGIVLSRGGWRIEYLGANTPMPDTIQVTFKTRPGLVVLAATTPQRFAQVAPELTRLASMAPLVLAGAGASTEFAMGIGARLLTGDPVTAAEHLASP